MSAEVLRIGSDVDGSESVLFGVNGVVVLGDGRVAVVNRGTSQIKLFSPTGVILGSFGRQGQGPDEFKNLWSVDIRGQDTLVVGDYRPWRFSFFTPEGHLLRRVELKPAVIERPDFAAPLAAGAGFMMEEPSFQVQDEMVDRVVPLRLYGEDGEHTSALGPFWLEQFGYLAREIGYVGSPIFGAHASFTRLRGDLIVYATGRHEQLEIWSTASELRRIIRWQSRDRTVAADDANVWRRQRRQEIESRVRVTPEMKPIIDAQVGEHLPVADRYPGHDQVVVSQDGDIWVKQYRRPLDAGPDLWWVFREDGQFTCSASTPERFRLMSVARNRVLGVMTDSLDVEYVLGYDVAYPASPAR